MDDVEPNESEQKLVRLLFKSGHSYTIVVPPNAYSKEYETVITKEKLIEIFGETLSIMDGFVIIPGENDSTCFVNIEDIEVVEIL